MFLFRLPNFVVPLSKNPAVEASFIIQLSPL